MEEGLEGVREERTVVRGLNVRQEWVSLTTYLRYSRIRGICSERDYTGLGGVVFVPLGRPLPPDVH